MTLELHNPEEAQSPEYLFWAAFLQDMFLPGTIRVTKTQVRVDLVKTQGLPWLVLERHGYRLTTITIKEVKA